WRRSPKPGSRRAARRRRRGHGACRGLPAGTASRPRRPSCCASENGSSAPRMSSRTTTTNCWAACRRSSRRRPDRRSPLRAERPPYDRTLLALHNRGARLRAIDLQPDGIDTEELARLLGDRRGARPKLAHIIPNFQNPAGRTLSLERREALLALAAQYGFMVFEDDP